MDLDMKLPRPRMLVINSEAFTLWKDHYARLQKVVAEWEPQGGHILTIRACFFYLVLCLLDADFMK